MVKPRAFVYIDGFNLYYGALKGTHEKWLDLQAWCALLLPQHDVRGIVYCTARVTSRPDDPDSHVRQDAYLRALGTLSDSTTLDITNYVTWLSTTPAIASISNANGSRGVATALSVGTVSISAVRGSLTGTASLTVQ